MSKAILFERQEAKVSVGDGRERTVRLQWNVVHPPGVPLGIAVSADGIHTVGGTPAFDSQKEEQAWRWQVDMAIVAQRYIKQGTVVPPDESLLSLASSLKDPEP